jgi:hypothetical protein
MKWHDKVRLDLIKLGYEYGQMDGTGSGSCLMADFGISGVDHSVMLSEI